MTSTDESIAYSCNCVLLFCSTCYKACDGDDCGSCSSSKGEDFDYTSMPAGTYYIQLESMFFFIYWVEIVTNTFRFTPHSGSGNYQLSVACDGAPNHNYDTNVLTCEQNTITKSTSDANRYQFFQITTNSQHDITFQTCGSSLDTNLYVYSDSLFSNELVGGDNDNCVSGHQEAYTQTGLPPGNYYVEMGYASGCSSTACHGAYTFSISCSGNYPSADPTPSPTGSPTDDPTKNPTPDTIAPTDDPTTDPTRDPTSNPTLNPTSAPTIPPSEAPSVSPSLSPSASPSAPPTAAPIDNPTKYPTARPSKSPTFGPDAEIGLQITATNIGNDDGANNNVGKEEVATVSPVEDSDMYYTIILVALIAAIVCCCGFIVATLWWNKKGDKKDIIDVVDEEGILATTVPAPGITPMSTSEVEMQHMAISVDSNHDPNAQFNRMNSLSSVQNMPNTMQMSSSPIHYQMAQMHATMNGVNGYAMNSMPMAAVNMNIVNAINQSVQPLQTPGVEADDENNDEIANLYTNVGGSVDPGNKDGTSEEDEEDYDPLYGKKNGVGAEQTDGL